MNKMKYIAAALVLSLAACSQEAPVAPPVEPAPPVETPTPVAPAEPPAVVEPVNPAEAATTVAQ
jgi:hypothetical protein